MRRVATCETSEECADDEEQEADPELVDAAAHAIRLRITQRHDRDAERRVDDAPDHKRRDREHEPREVVEVDRALVPDYVVAEREGLHGHQAVAAAADEARAGDGEDPRQLVEGEREQHHIDATQPQGGQAYAQRCDRRHDRREQHCHKRIPAKAVHEDARRPAADGEQRHLREGVDAAVAHDQVPRLRDDRLNEEEDQQRDQVGADVEPDEHEREHDPQDDGAADRIQRHPPPRRGGFIDCRSRLGSCGDAAHSRRTSPIPNRPLGRRISMRMISTKTPGCAHETP